MTERDETLKQAQATLQAGQHESGLALAQRVLEGAPDDIEALYMAAVAQRFLKRFDDAGSTLQLLHAASPEYGRAWQEAGHLARDAGDAETAIRSYARAVQFNPALEASWTAQAKLLSQVGRGGEAQTAAAQSDRLKALPRELLAVTNHLHEGRLLRAEEICRAFLRQNPRNVEGMRLLAQIGVKLGILDDAEFLLESAVTFEPDNVQLRLDYMDALRRRQKFELSREQAEALHKRDPDSPLFQSHLAIESMQTGDYDQASLRRPPDSWPLPCPVRRSS